MSFLKGSNPHLAAGTQQRVIGPNIKVNFVTRCARRLAIHERTLAQGLAGAEFPAGSHRIGPNLRCRPGFVSGRRRVNHVPLAPGAALGKDNVVSKEELVHLDGEVILIAKGGNFRVKLDNGHEVLAKLAGKVRRHRIRVVLGDRVTVAVSVYDPTKGFIVYRQR